KSVGLYATEAKARDAYKEFTDLLGSGEYKEAVSVVFVGKDSTSLIEQGNLLDSLRKSDIVILDVSTAQSLQMNTLHADFKSRFASVSAKSVYEALTADRWLFADEIQEISKTPHLITGFNGMPVGGKWIEPALKVESFISELVGKSDWRKAEGSEPFKGLISMKAAGGTGYATDLMAGKYLEHMKASARYAEEYKNVSLEDFKNKEQFSEERQLLNSFANALTMKEGENNGFGIASVNGQEIPVPIHENSAKPDMYWSDSADAIARTVVAYKMMGIELSASSVIKGDAVRAPLQTSPESIRVTPLSVISDFTGTKRFFTATPLWAEFMAEMMNIGYIPVHAESGKNVWQIERDEMNLKVDEYFDSAKFIKGEDFKEALAEAAKLFERRSIVVLAAQQDHWSLKTSAARELAAANNRDYIEQKSGDKFVKHTPQGEEITLSKSQVKDILREADSNSIVLFDRESLVGYNLDYGQKGEIAGNPVYLSVADKATSLTLLIHTFGRNRGKFDKAFAFIGGKDMGREAIKDVLLDNERTAENNLQAQTLNDALHQGMLNRFDKLLAASVSEENWKAVIDMRKDFQSPEGRNDYIGERDTAGIADSVSRSAQTDARRFKDISDKYILKLNDKQRDMVYLAIEADKSIAGKGLEYDGYHRDFAQMAAATAGWPRLDFKSIAEIIEGRYTKGELSGKVSMESVPSVQGTYIESMLHGLPVEASQGQAPAEKAAFRTKELISGIEAGRTGLQASGYHPLEVDTTAVFLADYLKALGLIDGRSIPYGILGVARGIAYGLGRYSDNDRATERMDRWEKIKFAAGNAVLGAKNGWVLGQLEHGAFSVTPQGAAIWLIAKDLKTDDNKAMDDLAEKITLGLDLISSQKVAQWEEELKDATKEEPAVEHNSDREKEAAQEYEAKKAALENDRPRANLQYYMKENADLVNSIRHSPLAPITLAAQSIEQDKYRNSLNELAKKGLKGIIQDSSAENVHFINAEADSEAKWEETVMAGHLNSRFSGVSGDKKMALDILLSSLDSPESFRQLSGLGELVSQYAKDDRLHTVEFKDKSAAFTANINDKEAAALAELLNSMPRIKEGGVELLDTSLSFGRAGSEFLKDAQSYVNGLFISDFLPKLVTADIEALVKETISDAEAEMIKPLVEEAAKSDNAVVVPVFIPEKYRRQTQKAVDGAGEYYRQIGMDVKFVQMHKDLTEMVSGYARLLSKHSDKKDYYPMEVITESVISVIAARFGTPIVAFVDLPLYSAVENTIDTIGEGSAFTSAMVGYHPFTAGKLGAYNRAPAALSGSLKKALLHEFGHTLRLGHSPENVPSVMQRSKGEPLNWSKNLRQSVTSSIVNLPYFRKENAREAGNKLLKSSFKLHFMRKPSVYTPDEVATIANNLKLYKYRNNIIKDMGNAKELAVNSGVQAVSEFSGQPLQQVAWNMASGLNGDDVAQGIPLSRLTDYLNRLNGNRFTAAYLNPARLTGEDVAFDPAARFVLAGKENGINNISPLLAGHKSGNGDGSSLQFFPDMESLKAFVSANGKEPVIVVVKQEAIEANPGMFRPMDLEEQRGLLISGGKLPDMTQEADNNGADNDGGSAPARVISAIDYTQAGTAAVKDGFISGSSLGGGHEKAASDRGTTVDYNGISLKNTAESGIFSYLMLLTLPLTTGPPQIDAYTLSSAIPFSVNQTFSFIISAISQLAIQINSILAKTSGIYIPGAVSDLHYLPWQVGGMIIETTGDFYSAVSGLTANIMLDLPWLAA
ncbi:MAG: hypothetical protein WC329_07725, partial [Candidatus Omnitrophota bacterium]